MTLTIQLTPEQEARLKSLAGEQPLDQYVHELLERLDEVNGRLGFLERMQNAPKNGAEALDYWEREGITGIFQDRPDSPEFARELRKTAEDRRHGG